MTAINAMHRGHNEAVTFIGAPFPTGGAFQAVDSYYSCDSCSYGEPTELTDYESHANLGPEGDLVGDTSITDAPLAYESG